MPNFDPLERCVYLLEFPTHPSDANIFEPRCEKTGFLHMQKKKADQLRGDRKLISAFVFATY